MNTKTYIAVSLAVAACNGWFGVVQAQPVGAAPKQAVHPRSLITPMEIAEYRRSIRSAPTPEAKRAIRDATYARLRQRATSRGMVMAEPTPHPVYGGLHWGDVSSPKKGNPLGAKSPVPPRAL